MGMRRRILPLIALLAGTLGVACDPVFWLVGSVKGPSGPLVGAEVTLLCPGDLTGDPTRRLTADALGRVSYRQIPTANTECRVLVSKPGFRPREIPLELICHSHFGLSCSSAQLDVEL